MAGFYTTQLANYAMQMPRAGTGRLLDLGPRLRRNAWLVSPIIGGGGSDSLSALFGASAAQTEGGTSAANAPVVPTVQWPTVEMEPFNFTISQAFDNQTDANTYGGSTYNFNISPAAQTILNVGQAVAGGGAGATRLHRVLSNTHLDATAAQPALGDIIHGTATRWERLAKGTANQVLTVNAGATDINWAAPALFDCTWYDFWVRVTNNGSLTIVASDCRGCVLWNSLAVYSGNVADSRANEWEYQTTLVRPRLTGDQSAVAAPVTLLTAAATGGGSIVLRITGDNTGYIQLVSSSFVAEYQVRASILVSKAKTASDYTIT